MTEKAIYNLIDDDAPTPAAVAEGMTLQLSEPGAASLDRPTSAGWRSPCVDLDDFDALRRYFLRQKPRRQLGQVMGAGKGSPLLWGLSPAGGHAACWSAVQPWQRQRKRHSHTAGRRLKDWLAAVTTQRPIEARTLGLLNVAYQLPDVAIVAEPKVWWSLLGTLIDHCANSQLQIDRHGWVHQLAWVELPLTLAYQLPRIDCVDTLARGAVQLLADSLEYILDTDGAPHGRILSGLPALVATWIRSGRLVRVQQSFELPGGSWRLMGAAVEYLLSSTGRDRRPMLSGSDFEPLPRRAVELAARVLPGKRAKRLARLAQHQVKPAAKSGFHHHCTEWGGVARMQAKRPGGGRTRLAVTFHDDPLSIQLEATGTLLVGQAAASVWWNQKPVDCDQHSSPWECVCWHSDHKVDYLEVERSLESGISWQRFFLLARRDQFLLVGDMLAARQPGPLALSASYPLAADVRLQPEAENRELYLMHQGKLRGLVLPLALPEWLTPRTADELTGEPDRIQLKQSSPAGRLLAPLWIDLDPRRSRLPRTWRRLTVAQQLEKQPPHVAAGFRIQVGAAQWLVYRSLAPRANRTVLGQNLSCEFYVGRFQNDGNCEELVSIE